MGFREAKDQPDGDTFVDGWTQDGWRLTILATQGGKRVRKGDEFGEVTLAVDLGRDGWLSSLVGEACLYVFWAGPSDTWTGTIDDTQFFPTKDSYTIIDERIFFWTAMGKTNRSMSPISGIARWITAGSLSFP
ncbi:hypothetical protein [Devosia aurantiaca]|uniref:Uncharacterized protein n=1 Tax=Devosia aurantiaca TaxID=2714858 RepID=A0A6M1SU91_9HYPH|nr:hypothetical protein [Devosia aurantiaca]NGP16541.1 hypothetical protein [Devosia aurantiaca]